MSDEVAKSVLRDWKAGKVVPAQLVRRAKKAAADHYAYELYKEETGQNG